MRRENDTTAHEPNAVTRAAIESVNRGEYVGDVDLTSVETMVRSILGGD